MDFWDATRHDAEFSMLFNEVMVSNSCFMMDIVIHECAEVFVGVRSLVDVGGVTGAIARAIAKAFPHIKCSVLDLPHVICGTQTDGTVEFVAGDMMHPVPSADDMLLKLACIHNGIIGDDTGQRLGIASHPSLTTRDVSVAAAAIDVLELGAAAGVIRTPTNVFGASDCDIFKRAATASILRIHADLFWDATNDVLVLGCHRRHHPPMTSSWLQMVLSSTLPLTSFIHSSTSPLLPLTKCLSLAPPLVSPVHPPTVDVPVVAAADVLELGVAVSINCPSAAVLVGRHIHMHVVIWAYMDTSLEIYTCTS
ncbi:hypothetical protein E2562_009358 [Oryza meyeriana var. granulata]|uniref:O-methyltransferase C-terminal domain-containing protein n=1 Tax=Oryza meyeriana var. granulata TaxID=110450 RepID=A0A6G1CGM0_9ORYZ|nr:hypothetical protein E2562_009358 [Oryza meyeriana var. granulata]